MPDRRALSFLTDDGVALAGEESGDGPPIVLLHGLTGTRRYILMGSRVLQRSGHRVLAYDARGHGDSAPAPDSSAYGYERLAGDLEQVLDASGIQTAVLAGVSMGAHTAVGLALKSPGRVSALALITPAFNPQWHPGPDAFKRWDALAGGLRDGGVEGFVSAYDLDAVPERWRQTMDRVLRQRMALHAHPEAVADALSAVPRSRPFEAIEELGAIAAPTVVLASRDEADPIHPLVIGERYAAAIPQAKLLVEESGSSPLAWQGGQVSQAIAELLARV